MRYILILLFGVLILAKKGFSQSSNDSCSTEINQMMKDFDFSEFEEKFFSKFLSRFTDKPHISYIYIERKPFVLSGVRLIYCKSLYLDIYFDKLKWQKKYNRNARWDFDLLKREKVTKIVFQGDKIRYKRP